MMNNVNMSGMNQMGGPVGGAMPMMNNGAGAARQPMPAADNSNQRSQLNTYIYEYFLRNGMYDCARSLLNSDQPLKVLKDSPGRNNGDDGADGDSKDDIDSKRPDDLPPPNLPSECPESCFLYEWWCLFWDMFNAQRGKGEGRSVLNYVNHTQSQSRNRQEQQAQMLRGLRSDMLPHQYQMMMRNQTNGMSMQHQNELQKKALQNRQGQNGTPQQQAMLQQQKQNQMQRDPSEGNGQQRPQSPGGSAENAPSPSKRARLEGPAFQQGQMPNGRGQAQGMPQQFQVPGGANTTQARSLAGYQQGLAQQQANQMPIKTTPNQGGPPNQGSPMMNQGPDGGNIANYYNPTDMGAGGMRGAPGGQGNGNGNHALQDYQMQLMLLEQQNKKRLMMARQEQDSMTTIPRPDGSGPGGPGMGPNGQPFQGASPQGARHSPNPTDGLNKRTPHMTAGNIPSPLPDGANRGSPGSMNFNMPGNGIDPNLNPKFYSQMNGMDPNMVPGIPNSMRPPSSHPGAGFNPMGQQQQLQIQQRQQAAAQQAQQQQANGQNWSGPNGPMVSQPGQGAPQQTMGTPRQGQMPPPSAPPAGAAANGRTQPSSPQQGAAAPPTPQQSNKPNPTNKKKTDAKDSKATKRATKGKATTANLTAGTPSADVPTDGPTPTPQTPITPVHPKSFNAGPNGAVPPTNGQNPAPPAAVGVAAAQQPDTSTLNNFAINEYDNYGINAFADPATGNMDVLQDFDFDSFLHQDNDGVDQFGFDAFPEMDNSNQIGAE